MSSALTKAEDEARRIADVHTRLNHVAETLQSLYARKFHGKLILHIEDGLPTRYTTEESHLVPRPPQRVGGI